MSGIEVDWHPLALACIAPRNVDEVAAHHRRYWQSITWKEVASALERFMKNVKSQDPDIAAAIERVKAWRAPPPRDIDPLDLQVFVQAMSPAHIADWAVSHFGFPSLVPILARPSISSAWMNGGYELTRAKNQVNARILRILVASADPSARAAARATLQPSWDEGDVEAHQHLAHAFFFDEALRTQALAEIFEQAPAFSSMQLTLARDEASIRKLLARRDKSQKLEYCELVSSLGEGALPILLELANAVRGTEPHRSHALAMTVLVCEASARHLATTLSHPSTRDVISDFFVRHPALAKAALPVAAAGASRNAALAKALLVRIAGPTQEAPEVPLVSLTDPAVPQVLRDAPWLAPTQAVPDLGIDLDAWPTSVSLPDKRREEGLAWFAKEQGNAPMMTDDEVKQYLIDRSDSVLHSFTHEGKCVPLETVLERFNAGKGGYQTQVPVLAKFGARALPGLRSNARALRWLVDEVLDAIDDPHLAFPLLQDLPVRWWWHLVHPRSAAVGLLALAHREPLAAIALRRLARAGHERVVLEIADTTKDPAAVRALLARDPRLDVLPVAAQTSTHGCSRPNLVDGRPLGDDVIMRILEMISMPLTDESYAGVDDVCRACEPRSLAEMAWDLAALADGGGNKGRQTHYPDWMRWSLRHFADDEVIRRMTPALKHVTIHRVLETLAREGDRAALIELATAQEREEVTGAIERVASAIRTTADELVETMLPTTQLEPEGTTTLVYGTHTLRVGFDTTLSPILFSGEKRLASLPRAKASDDPIAIRLAKERWEELKEDVRTIANLRMRTLEGAMRSGRRIPASQFVSGWATHPLGKHQARGIVWAVERDGTLVTFRVAEDSTFADIDDQSLLLAPSEFVRVPHPSELAPEIVNRWSTILNDYGLLQPAPQLARTPIAITPEERYTRELVRKLTTPIEYAAFGRALKQHRLQVTRPLSRGPGEVSINTRTSWTNGKSWISEYKLTFKVNGEMVPLSAVDPVELAESLYAMRTFIEAE